MTFLANEVRVLAPSLPTWRGLSRDLDITPYVRIVGQFLEELQLRRVSIIGNSMGGWIGLKILEDRPETVEALILEDSAGVSKSNFSKINQARKPILIIWGRDDKTIPVDRASLLHSNLEGSELVVMEETSHVPHWEKPDEFNPLVLDFLRKVQGNRSRLGR